MKKLSFVLLMLISTLYFVSCEKDKKTDVTEQCIFYNPFTSPCFSRLAAFSLDHFIITDNEAYQKFGDTIRDYPSGINCDTITLPVIDFNKYTLIGKHTGGGGCHAYYERQILQDDNAKIIIYRITVQYEGKCTMLYESRNWVLIPKLQNGYSVEFQVN